MLSDWGSEPETFAYRAKLKPPVRLVRGPRVRIDIATSSRSHRDRADLGTHLSPEHRNSYVRDSDVHQPISPFRDNNITKSTLPSRGEPVNTEILHGGPTPRICVRFAFPTLTYPVTSPPEIVRTEWEGLWRT